MANPTKEFFDELNRRGHEPLLEKASATVRLDLTRGRETEHWFMLIDHGDIRVSHNMAAADCVVKFDAAVFDDLARGRANAMAAVLRGTPHVEGDMGLLVLLQRLFPGPQGTREPRPAVRPAVRKGSS
jgi:putative sterol carrier protein